MLYPDYEAEAGEGGVGEEAAGEGRGDAPKASHTVTRVMAAAERLARLTLPKEGSDEDWEAGPRTDPLPAGAHPKSPVLRLRKEAQMLRDVGGSLGDHIDDGRSRSRVRGTTSASGSGGADSPRRLCRAASCPTKLRRNKSFKAKKSSS